MSDWTPKFKIGDRVAWAYTLHTGEFDKGLIVSINELGGRTYLVQWDRPIGNTRLLTEHETSLMLLPVLDRLAEIGKARPK